MIVIKNLLIGMKREDMWLFFAQLEFQDRNRNRRKRRSRLLNQILTWKPKSKLKSYVAKPLKKNRNGKRRSGLSGCKKKKDGKVLRCGEKSGVR